MIPTRQSPTLLAMAFFMAVLPLHAAGLDDLLDDKGSSTALAETGKFQVTWDAMLNELAKREYPKADAALKTLESERGYISPRRRDFIRLAGRVVRFKQSLDGDKAAFRGDYQKAGEGVAEAQQAMKAMQLEYQGMMKRNTSSSRLPPAVQANMEKKYSALEALLVERQKLLATMKGDAQGFEAARVSKLESEISAWIGKDDTEEDVVTGLVLATAYLDQVGDSEKIRTLSQGLSSKQEELAKSAKIVSAIAAEIEPLAAEGKGDEAQTRLETMIAKVETSNQSDFVKKTAVVKLKALGIKVASAKKTEKRDQALVAQRAADEKSTASADSAELSERLDVLEKKLNAAQATFGTVIQSFEGFSEYSGKFKSESDRGKMAANLKEQMKSGQVSKAKVDNMVKAKAEHAGILREVEILQTDAPKLSAVQKGRLASLHTTAATALELLQAVTP